MSAADNDEYEYERSAGIAIAKLLGLKANELGRYRLEGKVRVAGGGYKIAVSHSGQSLYRAIKRAVDEGEL